MGLGLVIYTKSSDARLVTRSMTDSRIGGWVGLSKSPLRNWGIGKRASGVAGKRGSGEAGEREGGRGRGRVRVGQPSGVWSVGGVKWIIIGW